MLRSLVITGIALLLSAGASMAQQPAPQHHLADSLRRKLDRISRNAELAHPDQTPTVMTEDEINDYLEAGQVVLPEGVKQVIFQAQSSVITALATIDFDELRAAQRAPNPLLSIFTGTHDVRVEADGAASRGEARIHARRVSIDGIEIPQAALEVFLSAYVTPKYPNVGIDTVLQLSDKIDIVAVGNHKLTLVQK